MRTLSLVPVGKRDQAPTDCGRPWDLEATAVSVTTDLRRGGVGTRCGRGADRVWYRPDGQGGSSFATAGWSRIITARSSRTHPATWLPESIGAAGSARIGAVAVTRCSDVSADSDVHLARRSRVNDGSRTE
jgi:hypothetical protein